MSTDQDMIDGRNAAILKELLAFYEELGVDTVLAEPAVQWSTAEGAPGEAVRAALKGAASAQDRKATPMPPVSVAAGRSGARPERPAARGSGSGPTAPFQSNTPAKAPPAPMAGRVARSQPARPASTGAAPGAAEARKLAAGVNSLSALGDALQAFEGCALRHTAKNLCLYRGAETSRLMIIGEAPGRDEDLAGKPFVGRAGQLLDRMLGAIGLGEADAHITNVVYWRPPGNRTPTLQETGACRPFLEKQVELVAPEVVLLLGGAAAKNIFDTTDGIMKSRGKWRKISIGGRELDALATLHPAYLLRTPAAKRLAWRDLLAVQARLG